MTDVTARKPQKPRAYHGRFMTVRTVAALMLREMTTTYGRSPGGYLWAVLEPALGIGLLTFIFSLALAKPALGVSFPLFYATGLVPFLMYLAISNAVAQSVNSAQNLLAYPRVTFMDTIMARAILNFMTQLMVAALLFSSIIKLTQAPTTPDYPKIMAAMLALFVFSTALGVMNCYLMAQLPLWQRVWGILNRPMFFVSAIFFLPDSVPEDFGNLLWWNPIVHLICATREGFYTGYESDFASLSYVFVVSLIMLVIGTTLLRRFHRDLAES